MTLALPDRPLDIGVMGGTFDPVHVGHIAAARLARRCAGLDVVLLVPAGIPPHKPGAEAPAADRLEMCRLAVEGESGLAIWDVEVRRGGRSYTVDTLRELRRLRPRDRLHLVLGWDAAREIGSWREPAEVLALADLVVLARPGVKAPTEADLRLAGLDPDRVRLCLEPTPDVNATEIRERAAAGQDLDGLVAPDVAAYIAAHRLYSA